MNKLLAIGIFMCLIVIFEFCSSSKKVGSANNIVSYSSGVQNIIVGACSPCHVGSSTRQQKLDSYELVKANISDIIRRVQLNPGDKGFMPLRHAKLSDSTIQTLISWKEGGFKE